MFSEQRTNTISITSPVLALHGSAGSGEQWQAFGKFCNFHGGFYAPDILGYGSMTGTKIDWVNRLEPLYQWVREQQPVHIVAHSFGCALALEIARTFPLHARSLTFYEPVIPSILKLSDEENDLRLLSELVSLSRILHKTSHDVGMESFINYWTGEDVWAGLSANAKARLATQAPVVYEDFCQAFAMNTTNLNTEGNNVPMTILTGGKTLPVALRMSELLHQQYSHATHLILPNLGHMGIFTSPDIVNSCLANMVSSYEFAT